MLCYVIKCNVMYLSIYIYMEGPRASENKAEQRKNGIEGEVLLLGKGCRREATFFSRRFWVHVAKLS